MRMSAWAEEHRFKTEQKQWWAVQAVKVVEPPVAEGHPVDGFVERKLEEAGLKMAEPAGAAELVRRVYFDLHGLPPTPDEVENFERAFLKDEEVALKALVDRLLASPRYGERWGQHWLDVVRYSESDGYRADGFRPGAYQYRDYVVRSFQEDKPYDQFVMEQLAADEMGVEDSETLVATGFLRHGVYEWNQRNAEMQREIMINEITGVTGEVFMGLGIGCAQCHDHKFDPILQKDYFALQAFLSTTGWPDDRPHATEEEVSKHQEGLQLWEEATAEIRLEIESLIGEGQREKFRFRVNSFPPEVQEMYRKPKDERTAYEEQIFQLVERQAKREILVTGKPEQLLKKDSPELKRYQELEGELAKFDGMKPKPLEMSFVSTDVQASAAKVMMGQGRKKREVKPGFLTILNEPDPVIEVSEKTTGRRLALAKWLVKEGNPFTARVMVNRIWQHHFGKGLVATPNDFGMLGQPPSHPELFDFLAAKFVEEGWSMKAMHRFLMMSRAYRQTAGYEPSALENQVDPGNRLLWRYPPRRLSAEQVRDAMLLISGELREKRGGASQGNDSPVRSLYVRKKRNTPDPVLHCFDAPQGFASAPDRLNTTTATQSLLLANSEWPLARARALSKRLLDGREAATKDEVAEAYRMIWGRDAETDQVEEAMRFLESQSGLIGSENPGAELSSPGRAAFADFCHALLSSNEFLYLH